MSNTLTLELFIEPSRQGEYFTLPFTMPPNVEALVLSYHYPRHNESQEAVKSGAFTARKEANIIDLGLIAPDGSQVGASGSDKTEITLSETLATPGYSPHALVPGEWQIIVGAYKVAAEGVTVRYELTFEPKRWRLLKGDLHTHTWASDGVHTAEELAWKALRNGLDFLAVTDHNMMSTKASLPSIPGLTLIPGVEWTHYKGHANFLGVDDPYSGSFMANTPDEVLERFAAARERGALIMVNHPFEETCPYLFDLNGLPFDCLEVWNGPMRISNLQALGLWQSLLAAGKKIPMCGGSDYHRDTPFIFLGGPTTCVYSFGTGASDILKALRQGHAFVTFASNGPSLDLRAGEATMGGTVSFAECSEMEIVAQGLEAGDILRVVTGQGTTDLLETAAPGNCVLSYKMIAPGFARVEIWRGFLPGLPRLPALLSNPIYFDK
jgi:hypothetical protein